MTTRWMPWRISWRLAAAGALLTALPTGLDAQANRPQTPQPAAAARPYVAIGCISQAPPASGRGATPAPVYLLTDRRGEQPFVYRLEGDPKQLGLHVGHSVEVTGPLTRDAGAPSNAPPRLKVQSLVWIASTCRDAR